MSMRVNLSGSCVVAPSGVTGTRSLSIGTGRCLATAQTLGGVQSVLTRLISLKRKSAMLASTRFRFVMQLESVFSRIDKMVH